MSSTDAPVTRIDRAFAALKQEGRSGFMAYITGGDPDLPRCRSIALRLALEGIDFLEVGVPFSDPLADGIANQLGAQRALGSGTTLPKIFELVAQIRERTQVPLILYSYLNPILQYGIERFESDAFQVGVDGLLVLDLPPDEKLVAERRAPKLHRIQLVAPTTPDPRLALIAGHASGFIYYVSREGVTGERVDLAPSIQGQITRIRRYSTLPIAVGFGISKPDQVRQVAQWAEAVVVGSAIVNKVGEWAREPDLDDRIGRFVAPLVAAVRG
jgi:tryptophan synthase alpha chain